MAQVRRLAPRRTAAANPTMMQNTALNSAVRCELIKLLGGARLRGHSPQGTAGSDAGDRLPRCRLSQSYALARMLGLELHVLNASTVLRRKLASGAISAAAGMRTFRLVR
jgi:hypothetical protein